MNEIALLYEFFFNWNTYQELLNYVYNNQDYSKIGWLILIVPVLILTIFYKLWDPVSSSKLKWLLTMVLISIVIYASITTILYNNPEIMAYLGSYLGGVDQVDADYFIFQMSIITVFYELIITFILSIFPFRLISTNNRKNPF